MDKRIQGKLLTKKKRLKQSCHSYSIKIDVSHLSKNTLNHLNMLFIEGKWLYNHILSSLSPFSYDTKEKFVNVFYPDHQEIKELKFISSQMKQGIQSSLIGNIFGLSKLKKNGNKIGKLKFKSKLNCIILKQYKCTYSLNFENNYIKLQGIKQKIKVNGLNQIPKNAEIANALLIKKDNNFYLNVITYQNKIDKNIPNNSIGIDFGSSTQLSLSNNIKIKYEVPVSNSIKHLDKQICKSRRMNKEKTHNYFKLLTRRSKQYQRINNKKKDIKNKIVNALTNNFKYICTQDEHINAWKNMNCSKKIQNTGLSGIITDIKRKSDTLILVNRFFPSSQLCNKCGNRRKLSLDERVYICDKCGYKEDRDINAGKNILNEGKKKIPMEHRELKLLEKDTSDFIKKLESIDGIKCFSLN